MAGLTVQTFVTTVWPVAALAVGYILGWWKSKTEISKLKLELSQLRQNIETKSIGQELMVIAESRKAMVGTRLITFHEADMRGWLTEPKALRLHAALDMLRDQGKAKKAPEPQCWIID
jgi:hypothetical protein